MAFRSKLRLWWQDIAAAALSITLLVAMAVVLAFFNGRPVFSFGVVTLNAIVSVISTSNKALVLFVMANTISQWKWMLFSSGPRRLRDFDRLADASRGPLGSMELLWNRKFKGGALVRFGAMITILSSTLDPFAQQLVQLRQEMTYADGESSLPFATRYSQGNLYSVFHTNIVDDDGRLDPLGEAPFSYADAEFTLQSAAVFGISADGAAISQQLAFECSSGECLFPEVTSLAICSRCQDVSSHLKRNAQSDGTLIFNLMRDQSVIRTEANSTEYRLPNGLYLNNPESALAGTGLVLMTMQGTTNGSNAVVMGDVDTLIWAQSIIKVDANHTPESAWPDFVVSATECALYYCVKNYTAEVRNSTLSEKSAALEGTIRVAESWSMPPGDMDEVMSDTVRQSLAYHPWESSISRTDLQLAHPDSDVSWNISQEAVVSISAFFQKTFAACLVSVNCTEDLNTWEPINGYFLGDGDLGTGQTPDQYEPSVARALWHTDNLNEMFDNVAMSMSNAIRNGADESRSSRGSVGRPMTVYVIQWPYIAPHCVAALGTILILWFTIAPRSGGGGGRVPVWKTSELAVLSRGDILGRSLKGAETLEELEEKSRRVVATLADVQLASGAGIGKSATWGDTGADEESLSDPGIQYHTRRHGDRYRRVPSPTIMEGMGGNRG